MRAYEAPPGSPGDVIIVVDDPDDVIELVKMADDIIDVNIDKGRVHLLVDDLVVTVVVRRPHEDDYDATARAAGGIPSVIEIPIPDRLARSG